MKKVVFAVSVWAVVGLMAGAAPAVDVCGYTVTQAGGFFCPVHVGDTLCLTRSAVIGNCADVLRCYAGNRTFCNAKAILTTEARPVCPQSSKRPRGLRCFVPDRVPPPPTPTPIETTVNVTLVEFSVTPDRDSVPHGHITFHVSNVGEDMHEFLVIRTDLEADMLPTEANGSYEEDGPGTDLLDEIELVPSGESRDLQIDLPAGKYVLICNMVHMEEDGEVEVHYQLGMRTGFTVE